MAETVSGILKLGRQGAGTLSTTSSSSGQVTVPAQLVREYGLVEGARVSGPVRDGKAGKELAGIETVCGLPPEGFRERTLFTRLTAIDPDDRFHLAASGDISMRAVDLVAPIGKGTRGLIVSPPKAGKTMLLEHIARGIRADEPESRIIVVLIDERPEEMTYFRRTVSAEVFASSSDQSSREHIELSELMLAHIRTEVECGHDVVVLVDSLTRLVRAFNRDVPDARGSGQGRGAARNRAPARTLSGGVDASAFEMPRRLFGAARNIEGGGSVTIIATILVDTGSRMDQLIYEEFKGTGNSEIILERSLAEARIFPAINISASGTRKEERLYSPEDTARLARLRRSLVDLKPRDAMLRLLALLDKYPTNEELLSSL